MPLNTVKAITERIGKKETELRDLHKQIGESEGDKRSELQTSFDSAANELDGMKADLARAQRVEGLEDSSGGGEGRSGDEPGHFIDDNEHRDSPLLNPDAHGYSLLRAISRRNNGEALNGVEGEISQELCKRAAEAGKTSQEDFMVPHTILVGRSGGDLERLREQRSNMLTSDSPGTIPVIQANTLIDVLRNRVVLSQMGTTVLSNMVGSFKVPKKLTKNTFSWVGEDEAAAGSKMTTGSVDFSEKTLSGWSSVSRSLVKQSSQDAENMVRMDLVEGIAVGLDWAGLANPAGNDGPVGLLYLANIPTVDHGTNGGATTWEKIVEFETKVYGNNADVDSMGYIFNAPTRGKLKTTEKAANTAQFIWTGSRRDSDVNGYRAAASNQLPSDLTKGSGTNLSAGVFGNFNDAIFALWGGLDVLVDPYSEGKKGNIILIVHQSADFNVRRDESFSRAVDIDAN